MKTSMIQSENLRQAETGLPWVEVITSGSGTLHLPEATTFRVRATAAVTVTIDGLLAMTMASGEIVIFNTGHGSPDDTSPYIAVVITGTAYVQVAADANRQRLQPNPYNLLNQPQASEETP